MSSTPRINWRLLVKNAIRILLMPLFLIQLLIVLVLTILPSVSIIQYHCTEAGHSIARPYLDVMIGVLCAA
jgi:hypothetical protein